MLDQMQARLDIAHIPDADAIYGPRRQLSEAISRHQWRRTPYTVRVGASSRSAYSTKPPKRIAARR